MRKVKDPWDLQKKSQSPPVDIWGPPVALVDHAGVDSKKLHVQGRRSYHSGDRLFASSLGIEQLSSDMKNT